MRMGRRIGLLAGIATLAGTATAQPAGQKVTGPVATYWVSAQTQTGFGMPGMGGGARPSMGAMMGMMMGGGMGGGGPQHTLTLQLGSGDKPQGQPSAEHLPPATLRAGRSLPLLTPKAQPTQRVEEEPSMPREFERPRGRLLIFWGCGEHARPGQPVVIDFSQVQPGKVPPGLAALGRGLGVTAMQPPSPTRHATYGEWPNEKTRTSVPGDGSLIGEHTVRGNYSPEIRFALAQNQDFLGPLELTTNAKAQGGWANLGWRAVPNAQAYLASAVGGGQDTMVLWTSSEAQASAFALPDYISPGEIGRLVAAKALLGPQATACAVPKEVVDAAPQALVQLAAYGGEANFVYPPRPADPKVAWDKQWQVKVRYRSATGGLLGMNMAEMAGDDRAGRGQPGQPPPPAQKGDKARQIMKGLGGALGLPRL